jgi:L-histidine N-alpha-methyltransferase
MRIEMPQALAVTTEERLTLVEADGAIKSDFAADVRAGLGGARKRLPCQYLYDAEGSALFEQICALPEYYLTRAEQEILDAHAGEIVAACPADAALVELGSGSAKKTRTLIEAALAHRSPLRYLPIDISRSMLEESSRALLADYPGVEITAIAAEYRAAGSGGSAIRSWCCGSAATSATSAALTRPAFCAACAPRCRRAIGC